MATVPSSYEPEKQHLGVGVAPRTPPRASRERPSPAKKFLTMVKTIEEDMEQFQAVARNNLELLSLASQLPPGSQKFVEMLIKEKTLEELASSGLSARGLRKRRRNFAQHLRQSWKLSTSWLPGKWGRLRRLVCLWDLFVLSSIPELSGVSQVHFRHVEAHSRSPFVGGQLDSWIFREKPRTLLVIWVWD